MYIFEGLHLADPALLTINEFAAHTGKYSFGHVFFSNVKHYSAFYSSYRCVLFLLLCQNSIFLNHPPKNTI